MAAKAVLFDFIGVLSDDENVQRAVFQEVFEGAGRALTEEDYLAELAGLSDLDAFERWLGRRDRLLAERHSREFLARTGDGSTVVRHLRRSVREAERWLPLAVVCGAPRLVVRTILTGAGLEVLRVLLNADDVASGKPDLEEYLRARGLLAVAAGAVAIGDSAPGRAAKAAGLRRVAVVGTHEPSRPADRDEIAPRLDVPLVRRMLREDGMGPRHS